MTTADVAFYLFSVFNGLRVFSYLPQIYCVARDTGGAAVISYWTWGLWAAANASTAAYAFLSLGDLPLAVINLLNSVCCAIVIGLTVVKRQQLSRRHAQGLGERRRTGALAHAEQ